MDQRFPCVYKASWMEMWVRQMLVRLLLWPMMLPVDWPSTCKMAVRQALPERRWIRLRIRGLSIGRCRGWGSCGNFRSWSLIFLNSFASGIFCTTNSRVGDRKRSMLGFCESKASALHVIRIHNPLSTYTIPGIPNRLNEGHRHNHIWGLVRH